jgi:hypothetical protein
MRPQYSVGLRVAKVVEFIKKSSTALASARKAHPQHQFRLGVGVPSDPDSTGWSSVILWSLTLPEEAQSQRMTFVPMQMNVLRRLLILAALSSLVVLAQDRRTIYVDRMEGLEPFVEKALLDAELPFDFIEEEKKPEMKATLKKMHSAYGEIIYKHKLGRNETHRLELRDVETNKVIAFHSFQLSDGEDARRKAAAEFASKVRDAMKKRGQR